MQPVAMISVKNLAKRYRLGAPSGPYRTLRDTLTDLATLPARLFRRDPSTQPREFWALKDVSFDIEPGEVVGIIGRNGAGKSTLLRILSRITEPTEGGIDLHGRVASLLEVGTGFHPELTGRENIFLNGAIMGMPRSQIRRQFDEIVAFAEVEKFIDTPVKHYSSGMYMRLAFAVAAHLEPEILLVDEVLAVGDAQFQKKCLDKMEGVGRSGRTVLFVSHNMPAILRLCSRAILLDKGCVKAQGPSAQVTTAYISTDNGVTGERVWPKNGDAPGNAIVRLSAVRVIVENQRNPDVIDVTKPFYIQIEFRVNEDGHVLVPNFHLVNDAGVTLFVALELGTPWTNVPRPRGEYSTAAIIPANLLPEGLFFVSVAISTLEPQVLHVFERDAVAFHANDAMDGSSARSNYAGYLPGVVRPKLRWISQSELLQHQHTITATSND